MHQDKLSTAYCDLIVRRYIKFLNKKNIDAIVTKNGEIVSNLQFTGD